ncbi:MAG TPA: methylmalonyl Co-A mutase-associated GTPase MeaB [Longimicrobiales bacterium]|nr:methylmalonyl Co-A mutase-associated GTPase MeaB [Longimicrobiales bacterium]
MSDATSASARARQQTGDLVRRFREGSPAALARAISIVEDQREGFQELLHELLAAGPRARRLGLTGPPGAGKSSLLAQLARRYRERGERLGVIAVDPTSPYSGGALLGDRIRMSDIATDPGIFIRSMASRGSLGGLATTTKEVLDLMDAFGFDRVLVETVGVGQTELEITAAADTVVVVLVPESGDAIQAMKAGLMEIADVFVVNKADRPGALRLVKEIRQALRLRGGRAPEAPAGHHGVRLDRPPRTTKPAEAGGGTAGGGKASGSAGGGARASGAPAGGIPVGATPSGGTWEIPVLTTDAQSGQGVDELLAAVDEHRAWLERSGELAARRRARAARRVRDVVERELRRAAATSPEARARLEAGLDRIDAGEETPYSVARRVVEALLR